MFTTGCKHHAFPLRRSPEWCAAELRSRCYRAYCYAHTLPFCDAYMYIVSRTVGATEHTATCTPETWADMLGNYQWCSTNIGAVISEEP